MTADTAQSTTDESTISLQRIPASVDPFGSTAASLGIEQQVTSLRQAAVAKVYLGMQQIRDNLGLISSALAEPPMPAVVVGSLTQPDGAAGARLQVQFDPATAGVSGMVRTTLAADDGTFTLTMPAGATVPSAGLALVVHGADANVTVTVPQDKVAANGLLGTIQLPAPLAPLPVSILAALEALVPAAQPASGLPQSPPPAHLPAVTIGDQDTCSQSFAAAEITESYPLGVFFRLVEPQMSIVNTVIPILAGQEDGFVPLPKYLTEVPATVDAAKAAADGEASKGHAGAGAADGRPGGVAAADGNTDPNAMYIDRVPVEQPLSADGFLDQIAGINPFGIFTADENVPMAATLGLGYVLRMSQQWTFKGLGLGDLVYSLPLAPGEQTEVAVFERTDTAQVFESESFTEQQAEEQSALSDTSTLATFTSAFTEAASGGSSFHADSDSWAAGGTILIASGGGGGSSSSGSSNTWMQGQRDSAQQAAQTTHSPAAALAAPATDPFAIVRPTGSSGPWHIAARVLTAAPATVPPADYDAIQCTPTSRNTVKLTHASLVPLEPILASAGFYPASPLPLPANSTDTAWAAFTNITGLVTGATRLGDELSLLYNAETIAGSVFAPVVDWVWNGSAFAGS